MVHWTGNYSSLAPGYGAATVGIKGIFLSIQTTQRVISLILSITVPRWHQAAVSTLWPPSAGFWLSLLSRQEYQLTMPATNQDTETKIIDRIYFQLPSRVFSAIIHQQNESAPWGACDGFMTTLGVLYLLKINGRKKKKEAKRNQTPFFRHWGQHTYLHLIGIGCLILFHVLTQLHRCS